MNPRTRRLVTVAVVLLVVPGAFLLTAPVVLGRWLLELVRLAAGVVPAEPAPASAPTVAEHVGTVSRSPRLVLVGRSGPFARGASAPPVIGRA